jgi:hypothetical protein
VSTPRLTDKARVLALTQTGHSVKEIAATLGCDVRAIYEARRRLGLAARRTKKAPRLVTDDLEGTHQKRGITLLRKLGWRVWTTNQGRASNVAPGLPDVLAIHARHGLLFWEAKGRTGHKQSPKQAEFEATCVAAGLAYVCGTIDDLTAHLTVRPIAAEAAA